MNKGKKPGLLIVIGKSKKGPKGLPSPSEPMGDEGDEGEYEDDSVEAELGSALADAISSGDGRSICEAVKAIIGEYERQPHEEGPHIGGEEEEAAGNEPY